ncbi:MAG TPA: hypothetical protein VMV92_21990 [Streptosporangiaceae bacterium]|nr:hypothetical protein [Streptosporangiaceae bacterium]
MTVIEHFLRAIKGWSIRISARNVCPYQSSALIAADAVPQRQLSDQQQAPAVFLERVVHGTRAGWGTTVENRHVRHRGVPGDLHGELATTPAGGMAERVRAQFGRHAHNVITRGTLRQEDGEPPAQRGKLTRFPWKHSPPA